MDKCDTTLGEYVLKDYRTKYEIIAENTYDWEFWLGPDGQYLYVSPSAKRITGYDPEEFKKDPGLGIRLIHPDDLQIFKAHREVVEKHCQTGEIEFRILHKDGRTVWISHVCQPIFNKGGQYLGVRGSNRDITDRRETQDALERSEKFVKKVLMSSLNGLYIYDLKESVNIFINPEYTRLTGYTIEQINAFSRKEFELLFHEEDRAKVAAHMNAISRAQDDDIFEIEYRFKKADGSWIWCLSRDSVFSRATDGSIRQYIGTFLDITAHKKAEEDLRQSRDQLETRVEERTSELRNREALLQQRNELLEIIFSNTHFLIAYMDTNFNFIRVNRAYAEADGRDQDYFIGKNHFELFPNPENQAIFHHVLKSGDSFSVAAKPFVYPENPERGTTYWDWSLFPVKGPEDAIKGLVLVLVEVTKTKIAEQKLIETNRSLEALKEKLIRENVYLQEEIKTSQDFDQIIGESDAIKRVLKQVEQVSKTDSTVLILGETGTGKELLARAIHAASKRSQEPLIKIDCASIPYALLESELFGHEKGSFTGAISSREGRFSLADGGTVFLDEIGELPSEVQSKLLRVVQEDEFESVGSSRTRKVDIRFIAATNRNLWKAVQEGNFRKDLYYRLSVFPIELPPLRKRGNDVILLASHFAQRFGKKMGKRTETLTDECIQNLKAYDWPGNVRELQNIIERSVITSKEGQIDIGVLLSEKPSRPNAESKKIHRTSEEEIYTVEQMHKLERENLFRALQQSGWRVSGAKGAAKLLGIPPSTLNSRMKALGIKRPA